MKESNERILPFRYLVTIFLIAAFLFALFAYVLYFQAKEGEEYGKWVLKTYRIISTARESQKHLVDAETGSRGYLLTRSKEFLDPYNTGKREVYKSFDDLEPLVENGELKDLLVVMRNKSDLAIKSLQQQINRFDNSNRRITVGDLRNTKAQMDAARSAMDKFVETARTLLETRTAVSTKAQRTYFTLLLTGSAISIGALFLALLVIINLLQKSCLIVSELDKTRETYTMLLENLNDGIYDYNPATGALVYSESYARMLGYNNNEIEKNITAINKMIHPEDLDQLLGIAEKYANKETSSFSTTFRMQHKNGNWRWIFSRAIGTWDANNKLIRMLGLNTDITEQRQREEEMKQLNTDMESFIYIISHDLRAPLVNLKGFTGEVDHSLKEISPQIERSLNSIDEEGRKIVRTAIEGDIPESLEFIKSAVERMDTLTTAILDLSRIGRIEFHNQLVDTAAIVKRCVDSLSFETNNNNIKVKVDDLPKVVSDPIALEQIFGNILDNAIKYSAPERKGLITITAKQLPWETQFHIKDNGRGIAENDYKKVFDVFRRAGNTGNVRGAGMGMTYVKALLRRLKGRIWFESVLNEGTTFSFSIPNSTSQKEAT